jgi:hypothetical protein
VKCGNTGTNGGKNVSNWKNAYPGSTGVKIAINGQDISVHRKQRRLSHRTIPESVFWLKDGEILVSGGENDKKLNAFRG